ncbi:hypothetical protein FA15DRAFT_671475 [Coprinopsis marcescibilis]|uniref:Uncharacterized protein n=1 Tax=Coprinopsis marcescibilis TaxID=230819 RepID=A0A5C3KPT3_COPMA|nr:hypothetical protein FA15DRAFT_671475 [Coprinopsis marcescibilis]
MVNVPQESPYASVQVPLIKSPSLRVPPKVEFPPDIHPLPDSVTAYFVYPFTLESHLTTLSANRRHTLAAHTLSRQTYLANREKEKERRRREALRRIAPGFADADGGMLVPEHRAVPGHKGSSSVDFSSSSATADGTTSAHQRSRSAMDDLVDRLAALDAASSTPPANSKPNSNSAPKPNSTRTTTLTQDFRTPSNITPVPPPPPPALGIPSPPPPPPAVSSFGQVGSQGERVSAPSPSLYPSPPPPPLYPSQILSAYGGITAQRLSLPGTVAPSSPPPPPPPFIGRR